MGGSAPWNVIEKASFFSKRSVSCLVSLSLTCLIEFYAVPATLKSFVFLVLDYWLNSFSFYSFSKKLDSCLFALILNGVPFTSFLGPIL